MSAADEIAEALALATSRWHWSPIGKGPHPAQTAAVIATIREMSPAVLAELLEGTTERDQFIGHGGRTRPFATRACGPWIPDETDGPAWTPTPPAEEQA